MGGAGRAIDPSTMPLTRLVNSAIDGVAEQMAEVEADVVKYAGSDLVCYRAGEPRASPRRRPPPGTRSLAFAREKLGAKARPRRGGDLHRPAGGGGRRARAGRPRLCRRGAGRASPARGAACDDDADRLAAFSRWRRLTEIDLRHGLGGRPCRRGLPDARLGRRRRGDGASRPRASRKWAAALSPPFRSPDCATRNSR